ncbi:MAG: Tat pathway signal sequence domain protein [Asticcacaulis sp.]
MSSKLRSLLLGLSLTGVLVANLPLDADAQSRNRDRESTENSAADRAREEEEWGVKNLRLDKRRADGPCPYVKVLYDAARYHEFENNVESSANAKWTGQINGVASDCAYRGDAPIELEMIVGFSLGKGPKAEGNGYTYRYWVAVTDRDNAVLAKEYFDLPVQFGSENTVNIATRVENIVIPRASADVAGSNFEVLVGFDVTPAMADFNRQGKRFRFARVAD